MKGNFETIINSEVPVLIDFYADWCAPCKTLSPVIKEVAQEMQNKIKVIKINVDTNREIAMRYQIQSIPTIMIFKKGQQLFRQAGVMNKLQLVNIVSKFQ